MNILKWLGDKFGLRIQLDKRSDFIPQYDDDGRMLDEQLNLYKDGLRYHLDRYDMVLKAKADKVMSQFKQLDDELAAILLKINWYKNRIKQVFEFIDKYIYDPLNEEFPWRLKTTLEREAEAKFNKQLTEAFAAEAARQNNKTTEV